MMNEILDRHLRRVTRVNGMEVRISGKFFDAYDPETGEVIATTIGSNTKRVADALILAVYQHNCRIVFERQGGKCYACHESNPLQFDHKISRAKGRDDRSENLRGVCHPMYGCKAHSKRHGG
jgi:hypothetical protein